MKTNPSSYDNIHYLIYQIHHPSGVLSPVSVVTLPHRRYRGADKSLVRSTFRCILFDGENISFDASRVVYINSTVEYQYNEILGTSEISLL